MAPLVSKLKSILRSTPLYAPVKWVAALLGQSTYPLPPSRLVFAEPFLQRAITRIGLNLDRGRTGSEFYSYFSEIWVDGYENERAGQYAAYLCHIPKDQSLPFLDIGCGAGEFVEFLSAHGIRAQGIDSNAAEVARAKKRGIEVHRADASAYLRDKDGCFAGISLLEVIEHLPPESLSPLLKNIFQVLNSGGIVLMETINIKHPLAFHSFYTDPTHTRPIPSDFLVFLTQWHGFTDVRLLYTTPMAFTWQQRRDPSRAYFTYAVLAAKPLGDSL